MIRNQYQSAPTRTASMRAITARMVGTYPKHPKPRLNSEKIACKAPLRKRKEGSGSAPAFDDPDQASAVEPHFRDGQPSPQQDGDDVREPRPQLRLGVHVAGRPGQAVARQHVVEHGRHLIAKMAAVAGDQLIDSR